VLVPGLMTSKEAAVAAIRRVLTALVLRGATRAAAQGGVDAVRSSAWSALAVAVATAQLAWANVREKKAKTASSPRKVLYGSAPAAAPSLRRGRRSRTRSATVTETPSYDRHRTRIRRYLVLIL